MAQSESSPSVKIYEFMSTGRLEARQLCRGPWFACSGCHANRNVNPTIVMHPAGTAESLSLHHASTWLSTRLADHNPCITWTGQVDKTARLQVRPRLPGKDLAWLVASNILNVRQSSQLPWLYFHPVWQLARPAPFGLAILLSRACRLLCFCSF